VKLAPGRYTLKIKYSASAAGNLWDAASNLGQKSILSGQLPITQNGILEASVKIDNNVKQFELRTFYNGAGTLKTESLEISQRLNIPIAMFISVLLVALVLLIRQYFSSVNNGTIRGLRLIDYTENNYTLVLVLMYFFLS
jgi:hypothetical protein